MFSSTHLGEVMETTCPQCKSRFRLTEKQLSQAFGKVCCGECGNVFNAMTDLQNYEGALPPDYFAQQAEDDEILQQRSLSITATDADADADDDAGDAADADAGAGIAADADVDADAGAEAGADADADANADADADASALVTDAGAGGVGWLPPEM